MATKAERGLGLAKMNREMIKNPPAAAHTMTSSADGEEIPGVGAIYTATINERENKSNPRNMGPERVGSFASQPMPVTSKASRHTGQVT